MDIKLAEISSIMSRLIQNIVFQLHKYCTLHKFEFKIGETLNRQVHSRVFINKGLIVK